MRTLPDSSELGLLDTASAELVDLIIDDLRDERGMHLPTAIAAASKTVPQPEENRHEP